MGGIITREVRGIPDEDIPTSEYSAGYPQSEVYGYFKYHEELKKAGTIANNDWAPRSFVYLGKQPDGYRIGYVHHGAGNKPIEVTPDVFSFSFLGHTGKFRMHMGRVLVYDTNGPQGEYGVDFSEFPHKIEIIAGDGYKYTFEGERRSVQPHSIRDNGENPCLPDKDYVLANYDAMPVATLSSWQLTKIVPPKYAGERTVEFKYSDPIYVESMMPGGYKEATSDKGGVNDLIMHTRYDTSIRQLLEISISGGCQIKFVYEPEDKVKDETAIVPSSVNSQLHVPRKLIGMGVVAGLPLFLATFEYNELTLASEISGSGKPYLSKLWLSSTIGTKDSDDGAYSFDYYGLNSKTDFSKLSKGFPALGTVSSDYWGYYTGDNEYDGESLGLLPEFSTESNGPNFDLSKRYPKFEGSVMGMLASIKYPTGGYTYFEYELNDAHKYVNRSASINKGLPTLLDYNRANTNKVGGVRIKKITHSTSSLARPSDLKSGDGIFREFIYSRSGTDRNLSSGILNRFPTYYISFEHTGVRTNRIAPFDQGFQSKDDSHITYSRVVETRNDGSSMEYCFSTYEDTPDDNFMGTTNGYNSEQNQFFREVVSLAAERGKLKSKRAFDAGKKLVAETIYDYKIDRPLMRTVQGVDKSNPAFEQITLVETPPLTKTTDRTFFNSGSAEKVSWFSYNKLGQRRQVESLDSKGDILQSYVQYAHETEELMEENHLLVQPTRVMRSHINKADGVTTVIEDKLYGYGGNRTNRKVRGASVVAARATATARTRGILDSPFDPPEVNGGNTPPGYETPDIDGIVWNRGLPCVMWIPQPREPITPLPLDLLFPVKSDFIYDSEGNMLQKKEKGVYYSYIWGYNKLYMIAEIENATLDVVDMALKGTPVEAKLTDDQEKLLRDIPGAIVKTYKYYPFVGVSEQTDPSGRKTFFEYGPNFRLSKITDDKGNIINKYEY